MGDLAIVLQSAATAAHIAVVRLVGGSRKWMRRRVSSPSLQGNGSDVPLMVPREVLPAGEMKARYHLTIDRYEPPPLNPAVVPDHLRDLLPLARKWGVGDDIIRDDLEEKASEAEKQELQLALRGRTRSITEWLDSFGNALMPEEAAAFMYMLQALDEMHLCGVSTIAGYGLSQRVA